jgi:D-serine deaminase-like pyridoxal phosphate-dependent protein
MEKFSWRDGVRNEEVLHRVKEEMNILHRLTCVGTAFYNTLLKERQGKTEVMERRERRRKQLLDDPKESRG